MSFRLDGTLVDKATHGVVMRFRDGWMDGVRHRQNLVEVPQAAQWDDHGGKPQASRRIIRASGSVVGSDHVDMWDKVVALNSLAATGKLVQLSFTDTGATTIVNAYISITYREEPPIEAQPVIVFDLVADCPDPRRYDISGGVPGVAIDGAPQPPP